jgi:uncharacterized protein YuzE
MEHMKQPSEVTWSDGSAYVRYADDAVPFAGMRDLEPSGSVAVDLGPAGEIIGIEIAFMDAAQLAIARQFARENGLAFPRDLTGVLPAAR